MKYLLLALSLVVSTQVYAQDEAPVFETLVEDNVFNTSSRVVIDERTIKDSRAPNIASLLATQANITIVSSPYQPNSIFIRGGDSGHVLIIVDGVPFYDASTIQRTFNLNAMDVKSVRRIEIIKGSQTVLYGGQALSGVILIDTIPQELTSKTGLQGQIGTHNFRDLSATHLEQTGENQGVLIRAQGSWKDIESPVLNSSETYSRNSWNGEAAYIFKGDIEAVLKGSYLQDDNFAASQNRFTYQMVDVEGFEQFSRQLASSLRVKLNTVPWQPRFVLSMQNSVRTFDMPINSTSPSAVTDQDYGANLRTLRADVTPYKDDLLTLNTGASYVYEDFVFRDATVEQSNNMAEQRGAYLKADVRVNNSFSVSAGGRVESWADKDAVSTYQLGVTLFDNTKLEMSTGYKIPSLSQLYSSYGNPTLAAERATLYSLTQDWQITEKQNLSVTFFSSYFSNLIVYVSGGPPPALGKYQNVSKAESKGAEVTYSWKPQEGSLIAATYGYQESKNTVTNTWLLKRPLVNGSLRYLQTFYRNTAGVELVGMGSRLDVGPGGTQPRLPGYVVANLSYSYDWGGGLTPFVRLNNVGNYRYQESLNSYSESFNAMGGAEYWF